MSESQKLLIALVLPRKIHCLKIVAYLSFIYLFI